MGDVHLKAQDIMLVLQRKYLQRWIDEATQLLRPGVIEVRCLENAQVMHSPNNEPQRHTNT